MVVKLTHTVTRFHVAMYRLTGGLLGGRVGRLRMLVLTTTGSKSGLNRDVPLAYGREGKNVFLIASNGGARDHPSWYKNLRANPQATVQIGSRVTQVHARDADAEERERLWKKMTTKHYAGYDGYQEKTERVIPVVVLEPASPGSLETLG
jgi:deazaflavin-dependent oxidoreductase (nitroreductase family)